MDDHLPPAPVRRRWRARALLALALAASAFGGGLASSLLADGDPPGTTPIAAVARTSDGSDLPSVIAAAMDSVVAVKVTSTRAMGPFGQPARVDGQGSGVIVGTDLVVTNAHVVEGATEVTVVFGDGEQAPATVLGADAAHDVAVLSTRTGDRPAIRMGSSTGLALGQEVVALGYPLGLGATATSGIVSGLDRSIDVSDPAGGAEHLEGMLQTDAAINAGNSGGPLVDASGRLVGINTASASASVAENIGFAIAIDQALPIIRDLAGTPL